MPRPRPTPRKLSVIRTADVTPNMKRITLGGDELAGFPEDREGSYVKLWFPLPGETEIRMPEEGGGRGGRGSGGPMMRTYTIRKYDAAAKELDIDFVVHGDEGPASKWAIEAQPGDEMIISGPGPGKMVDTSADWFLIAGDMTALPAMSTNLEQLPANARGYFVAEIQDEADKQELNGPEGIEIHWVVNPHPEKENSVLVDKVRELEFLDGRPSIWAACEFNNMRALRQYFRQEKGVDRFDIYVSSYWKAGVSEDEHKLAKRQDSEASGD